ncbi:hypothetical protein PAXRUDRAFT_69947, partial [Paxillus rubicundulus Ve08.2h10]
YGTKGTAIIMHTLLGLFPIQTTSTNAFKPLSHFHFFTYFLVPHIAAKLIAEDYKTTIANGYSHMTASSDVGALLNPENDEDAELDNI